MRPFLSEDAARSDEEIAAAAGTDKPLSAVYQETRLDNRWLDLRVPANAATKRIQSGVCHATIACTSNRQWTTSVWV
ncbi:hypothetical protein T484DRAFT_1824298 [Baffinella frigidus]|nr:hypothetical protein T484DRAFT_1824298 [Cryptophyta sp. CCMP2293]